MAIPQQRATLRKTWLTSAYPAGFDSIELASADAGFRSYWRVRSGQDSLILMDSPPDLEDARPWLVIHERLLRQGVRVPRIHAHDAGLGFILLEDMGAATLLQLIDDDNADDLLAAAITQLLRIQTIPPPADLPRYDAAMLLREMKLFEEWFLSRHLGIDLPPSRRAELDAILGLLVDAALAQPQLFVHRDYIVRNLMPADDGPCVIDFQGAVCGPIAYDPAALFRDAFLSWPRPRVEGWLTGYHRRATEAGLPVPELPQFLRDADWIGLQRHLKILGLFARLNYRDGKPKYLADAGRFIAYLDEVLPRYRELAPLQRLLDDTVKPAMMVRADAEPGRP